MVDELFHLLKRIDDTEDLDRIAERLQSSFSLLVSAVKDALMSKKLIDVKRLVREKLTHSIYIKEEEGMKEYLPKLEEIQDMDSLFDDFLLKYYFISYLNYVLLKDIGKLTGNETIASRFDEYEKAYVKLISKATFKKLMSVFHQCPNLKPTAPIGLPKVLFHLNDFWQDRTILNWITTFFSELSWFEWCLLVELRKKCIVVTYAIFPSVLCDVLEYLTSSAIEEMFEKMGVCIGLPENVYLSTITCPGVSEGMQDYCSGCTYIL